MGEPNGIPRAIALLSLAAFASAATTRVCDGMLPQIATEFRVTAGVAAQTITAYSATYGLLQIAWGLAGDRFGKERLILTGAALSIATTLACALSATFGQLVLARLIAGAAASGIIPLSLAWIGDAVPYERRQAVIARFIAGQISGVILGLAFGGVIGDALGWRATFWLIAASYVFACAGLLLQFRAALRAKPPQPPPIAQTLRRLLSLFARPWVRVVLAMTFLEGFLCFGALAYVTSMLHARLGLGFAAAGVTLATFGLGGVFYSLFAPRFVARFGEAGGARGSSALFAAAFLLFAWTPSAAVGVVASFCVGLAYYMLHNVLQVNATQMAPDARGAAVALFATAFFMGQGFGVAAAAPIVDRFGATPLFLLTAALLPPCALIFARELRRRDASQAMASGA